jgi:hypothetical protein
MLTLPAHFIDLLQPFSQLFHPRTWTKAQLLLLGDILSPGKRTITFALRVLGLAQDPGLAKYHHFLNRATWCPRVLSKHLFFLLLHHFDSAQGPPVFGTDETIERHRKPRIRAWGIYRDAVASSHSHLVKASVLACVGSA